MRGAVWAGIIYFLVTQTLLCSTEDNESERYSKNTLDAPLQQDRPVLQRENSNVWLNRPKRSSVIFPSSSSDDHGTFIEIHLDTNQLETNPIVFVNHTNTGLGNLDNNTVADASVNRRGISVQRKYPHHKLGLAMKTNRETASHSANRRTPLSMLGAAFNVINPFPYFRGSFRGVQHVFKGNMKPFMKTINKFNSKQIRPIKESHFSNVPTQIPQENVYEASFLTPPPALVVASSSVSANKGLNLQIPPELANYAALEVNLKPNGEINIVPVENNTPLTNQNNKSSVKNLVTSSNQMVNDVYSQNTNNEASPISQTLTDQYLQNSINNKVYKKSNLENLFQSSSNTNSAFSTDDFINKVKLVTDKPMVVNSIQDIINLQNLVAMNKNQNRALQFDELLKQNPIPIDLSTLYSSHLKKAKKLTANIQQTTVPPEHIYLLPFRVNEQPITRPQRPQTTNQRVPNINIQSHLKSPKVSHQRFHQRNADDDDVDNASEIYYIDITIPDNANESPIVNHQRIKQTNTKTRNKRSLTRTIDRRRENKPRGSRRYIDYNGWQPIDAVDPMANEPTLVYKPPTLQRVHFGKAPPEEKPLYPVRPINPPVFVLRAENPLKQVHSVYGTEHVNYLHINPQSNQARVYSTFNNDPVINREDNDQTKRKRKSPKVKIKVKELKPTEAITDEENVTTTEATLIKEQDNQTTKAESTLQSNNYIESTTPTTYFTTPSPSSTTAKLVPTKLSTVSFLDILSSSIPRENSKVSEKLEHLSSDTEADDENENESLDFNDKIVSDDGDYYIYYDYDDTYEDQKPSDDLATSASDPFASIIPLIPKSNPDDEKNESDEYKDNSDLSLEETGYKNIRKAALHELLQDFGGVQFDRYVASASENNAKSFNKPAGPKTFRFKQVLERRKNPSTRARKIGRFSNSKIQNTSIRPWYLIETREKPKERKRSRKRPESNSRQSFISDRHVSKFSDSQYIYNPYLEDHLNSFKPTESLTANSLSELLQIFKYVTTPSPFDNKVGKVDLKSRTFRYTKPTEVPRYFTSERPRRFTTYRYTLSPSKVQPTTDPTQLDVSVVDAPLNTVNDSVAETNSLDGYLFSDSEAAPEYTRPEVHPNIIRLTPKEKAIVRFDKITEKTPKMDRDAVRRGERDPFMVIETQARNNNSKDESAFLVQEGHSKVKIFGSYNNQAANFEDKKELQKIDPVAMMSKQYEHLVTHPPGVIVNPITMRNAVHNSGKHFIKTPFVITTTTEKNLKAMKPNPIRPKIITDLFATTQKAHPTIQSTTPKVRKDTTTNSQKNPRQDNLLTQKLSVTTLNNTSGTADKLQDKNSEFYDRSSEAIAGYDDFYEETGNIPNKKFSSNEAVKVSESSVDDDLIDISSLPSPLQAFSRLLFSYFPPPKKEPSGETGEESNEYLKHLRNVEQR